jgi:hypothetical protein
VGHTWTGPMIEGFDPSALDAIDEYDEREKRLTSAP